MHRISQILSTLSLPQLLLGILFGVLVAYFAWCVNSLSRSGAWGAAITGGLIFGLGGFSWAVLLLTFFSSSSLSSRTLAGSKAALGEKFAKGTQRDWGQVLANGGLGVLLVLFQFLLPGQPWPWLAFAGAMATVNGDTWATELGVLSPKPPRLITNGRVVEPGTSGAVSLWGTVATLGGAALIALLAGLFPSPLNLSRMLVVVTSGGLLGSLFDSLLGATVQAIYHCPSCEVETERHPRHTCGHVTSLARGWPWLNNDLVNFFASTLGAAVAVALWRLMV